MTTGFDEQDDRDALDAQAQNEERHRREDEAVTHGHEVLKQFRAGNAEFAREWEMGQQHIYDLTRRDKTCQK